MSRDVLNLILSPVSNVNKSANVRDLFEYDLIIVLFSTNFAQI